MEVARGVELFRQDNRGVLTTYRADGRAQLSNINYTVADDGLIRISVTDDRAKTRNLRRDPRASIYRSRDDFWAYVVLDGEVTLSDVAADPHDDAVEELVTLYRTVRGEHDDWDEYRRVMVRDKRLIVRLRPTHAYGMWPDA